MYFSSSQARRLLPMPPGPEMDTSRGRRSRPTALSSVAEDAEFVLPPDERRLRHVRAAMPAPLGYHAQRPPGRDRARLALEELLAGGLEGDGGGGRALGRLADEDAARRRDRLEAAGRIDQITGDHALIGGTEGDRGFAGQDTGPRLDTGTERPDGVDELEGRRGQRVPRRPRARPECPRRP